MAMRPFSRDPAAGPDEVLPDDVRPSRRCFMKTAGAVTGVAWLGAASEGSAGDDDASRPCRSPARVRFGHTDLCVSRYCQGTAFRHVERNDNPQARRILERCLDVGINFFDTAEAYGWGGSETVLGRVVAGRRDRVVICTKAAPSHPPQNDPDANKFKLGAKLALTREALFQKAEGSLERLGTDYIDLYLVHDPDEVPPPESIADSMDRLVRAGKIRYWGVSNFKPHDVARFHALGANGDKAPIAGIEDYYHICARHRLEPDMFALLQRTGMGLMAFSPQAEGRLSPGRPVDEKMAPVVAVLDAVARDLGATRPQVCIAWVLTRPEVTAVLGGAERPEHVSDNIQGTTLELPAEARAALNAASDRYQEDRKRAKC